MPSSTPQVNPTEQPNTPSSPPPANQQDTGFVSTDPAIRARIEAMSRAAETGQTLGRAQIMAIQAPTSPSGAVSTPAGIQGALPPSGAPVAGYGTPPGANLTDTRRLDYAGPTPGAGSVRQEYTGEQRLADTLAQLRKSQPGASDAELLARRERALRAEAGDFPLIEDVARPGTTLKGVSYDPTTNSYKDSLSGMFYAGFDPTRGHIFTPEQRIQVSNMPMAAEGGVLTTEQFREGVSALGKAIEYAQFSPLPASGITAAGTGELTLTNTDLQPLQDELDRAKSYRDDPSSDPTFKILDDMMTRSEARRQSMIEDIHAQAEVARDDQRELNKKAESRVKVAMANLGILGSTQDLQFTADTIRQGEKALQAISNSERKAITEANLAFEERDFSLAMKKVELAENRRKEYTDLAIKTFQLKQNYEESLLQRQKYRRELADKDLEFAAKTGAEWTDISPEKQTQWMTDFGVSSKAMESYFDIARNKVIAESTKNELERQKAYFDILGSGIKAAEGLSPDQSIDIPLPGGEFLTVSGKYTAKNGWKTSTMSLGAGPQGPAGQYLVTHDEAGMPKNIQFIANSYTAPHFNDDTSTWYTFDPSNFTKTQVFNQGQYGEGIVGMNIASEYVSGLEQRFKITQEPGDGFSHGNLTGWDIGGMGEGAPINMPNFTGRVVGMGFEDKNYTKNPGGMKAYGNYVDIQDMNSGAIFRFAHMKGTELTDGQIVNPGELIGKVGNTGFSTGPHLHFEILNSDGSHVTPNRNAPGAAESVSSTALKAAPTAIIPSFVHPEDITQFQKDTGLTYRPDSKRIQEEFANWKGEQRKTLRETTERNIDIALKRADALEGNEIVKDYRQAIISAQRMEVSLKSMEEKLKRGEGIGQEGQAIIISFNKMLDPGSVVREGEYDRATFTDTKLKAAWEKGKNWIARGGVGVRPEELRAYAELGIAFSESMKQYGFMPLVENEIERARISKYDPRVVLGDSRLVPNAFAQGPDGKWYEVTPDDEQYLDAFFTGKIDLY